jgi:hypothetical protein
MRILHRFLLLVAVAMPCWAIFPLPANAADGGTQQQATRPSIAELPQLIADLDSPYYETRQKAAHRIEQLLAIPEHATFLAEQFHRLAVRPDISYEVRWRVTAWRTRLPAVISARPASVSAAEVDRLVQQLDDDSFSVRIGAGERLQWLAGDERLAGTVMALLKDRLSASDLSDEALRRLDAAWDIAWGMWLNSDAAKGRPPSATDAQLAEWLRALLQPITPGDRAAARKRQLARHELLSALAHDGEVPRIRAAIRDAVESRGNAALQQKAAADLKELMDLLRPSMVAEIWRGQRLVTEQHLVIGVPQTGPFSLRPSHFDSINETKAHCVSGNTLSPGEYDVGIAFPMPRQAGAGFFYLVNLPAPRRQIAYACYAKTDARARLADITRRTLESFLKTKKVLRDDEVGMLSQLDLDEVSRFAPRYFFLIEDTAADDDLEFEADAPAARRTGKPSLFGSVCEQLALGGTREAAPGLLEAIRKKRFLPPTPQDPYQLPWIAALAIAHRDPWPSAEAWLAEVSSSKELLIKDQAGGPELAATAAALLLTRHNQSLKSFALRPVIDAKLGGLGVEGFRFTSVEGPQKFQDWWKKQALDAKGKP